jgi:5-methylcytosine-specific restriction endonuclease McrA
LWKGGKAKYLFRNVSEHQYRKWRRAVLTRDNFTCVLCGIKRTEENAIPLHVDHIQPFAERPDLVIDLNNVRTLCVPCHIGTDTYGFRIGWKMKKRATHNETT